METKMKKEEFVEKLKFAVSKNTVYAKGCFGQPVTKNLLNQKKKQYPTWYNDKMDKFNSLIGKHYFAFDCIGLIKGIGWGWNATESDELGGCVYQSNNIPDTTELGLINSCKDISSDMNKIVPGELMYMKGHCGTYIGNNEVIECTTAKAGNVQILPLSYHKWTLHGKLPWVSYEEDWTESVEKWYRIRKTWKDAASQKGAYKDLALAKKNCPAGYKVFDTLGKCVFDNKPICPYAEPTVTLFKGCTKGNDVRWLQWHLIKLGFLAEKYDGVHDSLDGSFGNATKKAFNKFQESYPETGKLNKLTGKYEPDGRCGKGSREKLKSLL